MRELFMLHKYRVMDAMSKNVYKVRIDDDFAKVEDIMHSHKVHHVPVVDKADEIVGLVSQRDLFRISKPRLTDEGYQYNPTELNEFILKHVMTAAPYTAKYDTALSEVMTIMAQNKYGCVPVFDDANKLMGILTQTDILKFIVKEFL